MRVCRPLSVVCAALLALWLPIARAGEDAGQKLRPPEGGAAPQVPDPEVTPELRARIEALIRGLGAEKFDDRQAAREGLLAVGRPALAALRAATASRDPEVADAARKLVAEIEGGKARTTVKVARSGSRQAGNLEIAVTSSVDKVTVRDFKGAFSVAVEPVGGKAALYSEPTREEFVRKHPELWSKYAEPALDETDSERAVKEAMVRELIPQARGQFLKAHEREPKPEELAALEKLIREKLEQAFKKRADVRGQPPAEEKKDPPVVAPRRQPPAEPELKPLD